MEQNKMEQKQKQKIDKVIVTCVINLSEALAETKGIDNMENDFIDLFKNLLKINKKLCNKSDEMSKIEASEYYHNAVNYYKDDVETEEEDEKEDDYGGIQFLDR